MRLILQEQDVQKLISKIKRILTKAKDSSIINLELEEETFIPVDESKGDKSLFLNVRGIKVESSYVVNNWRFVAIIEQGNDGNIIKSIDSKYENQIPSLYKASKLMCEHCNQVRNRKDTYLLFNELTREFKQVGKSCLKEFSQGLSVGTCSIIISIINLLEEFSSIKDETVGSSNGYLRHEYVKRVSYNYVREFGYISKDTSREIAKLVFNSYDFINNQEDVIEDLARIDSWVNELHPTNDYLKNAKNMWSSQYVKYTDIPLISSLINTYFKELTSKRKLNNEYLGEVGDKVVFKVASSRVVYCKGKYAYQGEYVFLIELYDENDHVIVWSTSTKVHEGDVIKATIKECKEHNGVKQTIVTRGTLLNRSPNDDDKNVFVDKTSYGNPLKALDDLISILDS